jgi:hypothetical protein
MAYQYGNECIDGNVCFSEHSSCTGCCNLEPGSAVIFGHGEWWCLFCSLANEFLTQEEFENLLNKEKEHKLKYHEERVKTLRKELGRC